MLHDAYVVLLEKGGPRALGIDADPWKARAYVTQTAIHKALDEGKRVGRKRTRALGENALELADAGPAPDAHIASSEQSALVRKIVRELPIRQRAIVDLRFYRDWSPAEIQSFLGISSRTYRRHLERAVRAIAEQYAPTAQERP